MAHAPGKELSHVGGVGAPQQDPVVLQFGRVATGLDEEESEGLKLSEMRPPGGQECVDFSLSPTPAADRRIGAQGHRQRPHPCFHGTSACLSRFKVILSPSPSIKYRSKDPEVRSTVPFSLEKVGLN